ncbi:MAG TPA: phosphoglycerate mutase family protein [Allosphingosinicella sp.]|nr:phosphoglycerate mutase family protein [Allosphingosinicella sp.]
MSPIRTVSAFLLLALAACFPVAPQEPPGPSYYVMRHLEAQQGPADPGLTAEGQRQATLLPSFFQGDPPRAIYVSSTRRAQETAAPLARALGITPKVYDPANTPALVQMVKAEPGPVLVIGHSNTVPDIVQQLGGQRPEPIAHNQHGDIWHVSGIHLNTLRLTLGG